jgi:hypothetical protein
VCGIIDDVDGIDVIGLDWFLGHLTKHLTKKRPWSDVLSFGVCCVIVLFIRLLWLPGRHYCLTLCSQLVYFIGWSKQ